MANQAKRSVKIQDFVVNGAGICCVALGRASGRVMATGGEDRKVNVWAVGQPNCILTLPGHTTPVESVQFNGSEQVLGTGSQSGTVKTWDLEASKLIHTLTGHKSAIRCMDFFPYSDVIVTGSLDTNVKVWDVRKKSCLVTYKGHNGAINDVKFSPDGRWVISCGDDGVAKLWDLTTHKSIHDFAHSGAVNKVEFHPRDFLMATSGTSRVIKFWDLESFSLVSSTSPPDAQTAQCLCFHSDGLCLFSGFKDFVKVFSWEPQLCLDTFTNSWGTVNDLYHADGQLTGISVQQTNISLWLMDVRGVEEVQKNKDHPLDMELPVQSFPQSDAASAEAAFVSSGDQVQATSGVKRFMESTPAAPQGAPTRSVESKSSGTRKMFAARPFTSSSKQRTEKVDPQEQQMVPPAAAPTASVPLKAGFSGRAQSFSAGDENSDDPFIARQALRRSPPLVFKLLSNDRTSVARESPKKSPPVPSKHNVPVEIVVAPLGKERCPSDPSDEACIKRDPPTLQEVPKVAPAAASVEERRPRLRSLDESRPTTRVAVKPCPVAAAADVSVEDFLSEMPQRSDEPTAFLPARILDPVSVGDTDEALQMLRKSHETICQVLTGRRNNLSRVAGLWANGQIKEAIEACVMASDLAVLVDLLGILLTKPTLWTLDLCASVLPQMHRLVSSKYESYVNTGARVVKMIINRFHGVIKTNVSSPPDSTVDIVREERYSRCRVCYDSLLSLRSVVGCRPNQVGNLGPLYRELAVALSVLE